MMPAPDLSQVTSCNDLPPSLRGRAVTVYGASSADIDPAYKEAARELGEGIARLGLMLVSGGGRKGLMGAATDGALSAGGVTAGILPAFMIRRGWNHPGLSHTLSVADMHTRKALMAALAGVVVAMPGGIGTFEEIFEIITWRQLGLWKGRAVFLNTLGYYDPLLEMLREAEAQHFFKRPGGSLYPLFEVAATPGEALSIIRSCLCD